jgi:hypothetical protein
MTHPSAASRHALVASALSVTALLAAAACSAKGPGRAPSPTGPASASAGQSPGSSRALTGDQAKAALVTEADLGEPWEPTEGAATWRDGLLKASTENADCQRLLDALYTEELFGTPTGPRATVGLDDVESAAQLRYQVAAHRAADVDRTLAWLKSLPEKCGEFTAATPHDGMQDVQVSELPLPEVGDARQALRVSLAGETEDGELFVLTMDVAAVRVGDDAISLTHGGLGDVYAEVTQAAVQLGAHRLTEIRQQGRADV